MNIFALNGKSGYFLKKSLFVQIILLNINHFLKSHFSILSVCTIIMTIYRFFQIYFTFPLNVLLGILSIDFLLQLSNPISDNFLRRKSTIVKTSERSCIVHTSQHGKSLWIKSSSSLKMTAVLSKALQWTQLSFLIHERSFQLSQQTKRYSPIQSPFPSFLYFSHLDTFFVR